MKVTMKIPTFIYSFFALIALGTAGCAKHNITGLNIALDEVVGYGQVDAHFCTSAPGPSKQYLKYLFILDHAASNQGGFPNPLTPNVQMNQDANGSLRYGPIRAFINGLTPVPNNITSFGIIDFNDAATQPGNLPNLQGFDPNTADFLSILQTDWIGGGSAATPQPTDSGFTNYVAALNLAQQLIQSDATGEAALHQTPIVTTTYVMVFASDGEPIVATPGAANPVYTQTFASDVKPAIDSIMNLKNDPNFGSYIGSITLNTAYYYNNIQNPVPDANAVNLLQQMASEGDGQYIQFASGQNPLYQQFTPPARNVVNELADVFVENENAVWWDDGNFYADTDGDGLPDLIEMQLGSNPSAVDSDGNGVSDLVEYRTKGQPCSGVNCNPATRDQYARCAGYQHQTAANGTVTFGPASANDGLNDCEKYVLGGLVGSFNSNGDLIPDFFAFKNALPIIPGTANAAFADPFGDGINNYDKLKDGLPIQVSMHSLLSFNNRSTELTVESQPSPQVTCYHLTVEDIALSASQNTMKVMVVQNMSTLQDKPFLVFAERPVDGTNTASFQPGDFHN